MEIFLQWYDDLDDIIGVVRFAWPRILSFLVALTLFIATGVACVMVPKVFVAVIATASSAFLIEAVRKRRLQPTDR